MLRPLTFLSAIALTPLCALAAEEPKQATASFRFFTFDSKDRSTLSVLSGKSTWREIDRPSTSLGKPVRIKFSGPIALFDSPPADAKSADKTKKPVPAVTFTPLASPRQIVIIFPDKGARRAVVVPDSADTFDFGTCLLLNLTQKPLRFTFADQPTVIQPGKFARTAPLNEKAAAGDAGVKIESQEGDAIRLRYSTVWPYNPKVRTLVFIREDASGALIVRPIRSADVASLNEAAPDKPAKGAASAR